MSEIIPKIIFIVPYRNRENEKLHFLLQMTYILEDLNREDYEIYFSHQMDKRTFNRGATKNIGFIVCKEKYPDDYKNITFVFNDVDTIMAVKNKIDYNTDRGIIKHFYGFNFALGGIFSIKGQDFEKILGFPNNWGWGLEDNELNNRALKNNLKIDRTNWYPLFNNNVIYLVDSVKKLVNRNEPDKYFSNRLDNINHINNLTYDIELNEENTKMNIVKSYIINIKTFNTLYNCDKQIFYNQDTIKNNKLKIHNPRDSISNRWHIKKI